MHDTRPPARQQARRRKPKAHRLAIGSPSIGTPALGKVLAATDSSAGAPVLGMPAIGQRHALRSTVARRRHDLMAANLEVRSLVIGNDEPIGESAGEQPKPQPLRRRRITKEMRVIRILCELAAEGVPIAKVRDRKGDLILKRKVENKFGETLSRQTFRRGLDRYREGERFE
jgi:hypothetical protein